MALDSDFLFTHPAALRYARQFARGRQQQLSDSVFTREAGARRLYVAEPTPTITGTMADERLVCGAGDVVRLSRLAHGGGEGSPG